MKIMNLETNKLIGDSVLINGVIIRAIRLHSLNEWYFDRSYHLIWSQKKSKAEIEVIFGMLN